MTFGKDPLSRRATSPIDTVSQGFEINPVIRAAHAKALKLFEGDAIQPRDFSDLYDTASIERDLAHIQHLKTEVFEHGSGKIAADILEAIMYQHTELSNWFGPEAHTIKTSEFDDIVNGVDLMLEFRKENMTPTHLALGIDATYGTQTIGKKFDRIKRDIDSDRLTQVKYFESSDGRFKGRLSHIPRIILGVEKNNVLSLAQLWTEDKKRELGAHPVQRLLVGQARSQLTAFERYATAHRKHNAAESYAIARATLAEVPMATSTDDTSFGNDRVHAEILQQLDMFDN